MATLSPAQVRKLRVDTFARLIEDQLGQMTKIYFGRDDLDNSNQAHEYKYLIHCAAEVQRLATSALNEMLTTSHWNGPPMPSKGPNDE